MWPLHHSKRQNSSSSYLRKICRKDEWKTAFRTPIGNVGYKVTPFGLTNAPAMLQALVNDVYMRSIIGLRKLFRFLLTSLTTEFVPVYMQLTTDRNRQLPATDVFPSAGQSEIDKSTQVITGGTSVEAHRKCLKMGDINKLCTSANKWEFQLAVRILLTWWRKCLAKPTTTMASLWVFVGTYSLGKQTVGEVFVLLWRALQ